MYRIDKFLEYYKSLDDCDCEISPGVWVHAQPLPFPHYILEKGFWREMKKRIKDAKAIMQGKAVAVTWKKDL